MVPLVVPALAKKGIDLIVRRDDLVDPLLSGNKFYKLYWNLEEARARDLPSVASLGGPWSNHLHALAAAGYQQGIRTIGVIRGERPAELSATLRDAEALGMALCFISRDDYRQLTRQADMSPLQQWLEARYGRLLLIPEGGGNVAGARGAEAMAWAIEQQLGGDYQEVCVACGTGTTLAGVAAALPDGKRACGFSVLKGAGKLAADISRLYRCLQPRPRPMAWRLVSGFHGGGYAARLPAGLVDFQQRFEQEQGFLLDPVYTLKLFFAVLQLAQDGYWRRGTRLVVVHSGGLQGRRGFGQPFTELSGLLNKKPITV